MKDQKIIDQLLQAVGGKENVKNYEHCATRLRIILKNDALLDKRRQKTFLKAKVISLIQDSISLFLGLEK